MKKSNFNDEVAQFQGSLENLQLMGAADVSDDPFFKFMWQAGQSPLKGGKHAAKFQARMKQMLMSRAIQNQLRPMGHANWPDVPEDEAIVIGYEIARGRPARPISIPMNLLARHLLVTGSSGAGKTVFLGWLIHQLINKGVTIQFEDHKGEGRRLMNLYPDTVVFRPHQEPWNILEPIGDHVTYWFGLFSELAKAVVLRSETWPLLVSLMTRVEQGMSRNAPWPSSKDLEQIAGTVADREGERKLKTAAAAIEPLNRALGSTAYIRKSPDIEHKYRIVVHEYLGLPPGIHRFIAAIRLLRTQMKASVEGHVHNLKHIYVSDEATMEFGKELGSRSGSGYIPPQRRNVTQIRSSGIGILAGVQMPSEIDSALKANVATIVCLRTPDPTNAREAQRMIGLPEQCIQEIQSLPVGTGYVRSEGTQPVKIHIPPFDLGRYPSDEEVAERMKPELEWLEQNTVFSEIKEEIAKPLSYQEIVGGKSDMTEETDIPDDARRPEVLREYREFVTELEKNPEAGVAEHYRNLSWGGAHGDRVKGELLEYGLIRTEQQTSRNGRPRQKLIVSEKGKDFFDA